MEESGILKSVNHFDGWSIIPSQVQQHIIGQVLMHPRLTYLEFDEEGRIRGASFDPVPWEDEGEEVEGEGDQ